MSRDYQSQVGKEHYNFETYIEHGRWISYWHQSKVILSFQPDTVLNVGVGPGITEYLLRSQGVIVSTMDITEGLGADIVGTVTKIPLDTNSFDIATAFQVLEHIEYADLPDALRELARVSTKAVVVSLPDRSRHALLRYRLPILGKVEWFATLPSLRRREHVFDGQHYWELGRKGYSAKGVIAAAKECGLSIVDEFRNPDHPFHHFFVFAVSE